MRYLRAGPLALLCFVAAGFTVAAFAVLSVTLASGLH